jgi:hypothetical protein
MTTESSRRLTRRFTADEVLQMVEHGVLGEDEPARLRRAGAARQRWSSLQLGSAQRPKAEVISLAILRMPPQPRMGMG